MVFYVWKGADYVSYARSGLLVPSLNLKCSLYSSNSTDINATYSNASMIDNTNVSITADSGGWFSGYYEVYLFYR